MHLNTKSDGLIHNNNQHLIKYILLDIHGVLTEGNERKSFLSVMHKKYNIDESTHNALWANHITKLDKGIEKDSEYINLFNETFNTSFTIKKYYAYFLNEIRVNIT